MVVFLLPHFGPAGELVCTCRPIPLPTARRGAELWRAPSVSITARAISIEGFKIGESDEILRDANPELPALTDKLEEMKKVDEMMHPGAPFAGRITLEAEPRVPFSLIRRALLAASAAGYDDVNCAVRTAH
jgi:hypothetical protein